MLSDFIEPIQLHNSLPRLPATTHNIGASTRTPSALADEPSLHEDRTPCAPFHEDQLESRRQSPILSFSSLPHRGAPRQVPLFQDSCTRRTAFSRGLCEALSESICPLRHVDDFPTLGLLSGLRGHRERSRRPSRVPLTKGSGSVRLARAGRRRQICAGLISFLERCQVSLAWHSGPEILPPSRTRPAQGYIRHERGSSARGHLCCPLMEALPNLGLRLNPNLLRLVVRDRTFWRVGSAQPPSDPSPKWLPCP